MMVAVATYTSMKARFSTAITVVRVGTGANIPCIGLWDIVFYVDIQAMAVSEVLTIEF